MIKIKRGLIVLIAMLAFSAPTLAQEAGASVQGSDKIQESVEGSEKKGGTEPYLPTTFESN